MKRALRNTSRQKPYTPDFTKSEPSITVTKPDLRVEEILFAAYMRQKELCEWAMQRYHMEVARFTAYRAKGMARGIAKKLKPSHSDKVTK